MFITTKFIAEMHHISLEQAKRAQFLVKQRNHKGLSLAQKMICLDEIHAMSHVFCIECEDYSRSTIATKKCRDCHRQYCQKHIVKRRCQECSEVARSTSMLALVKHIIARRRKDEALVRLAALIPSEIGKEK